jgi:Papain family cysteine protease
MAVTIYLKELRAHALLTEEEYESLASTGAQSAEELYALTLHFPDLLADELPGSNLAKISALAAQRTTLAFRNAALARSASPLVFSKGARQPPNVPYPIGAQAASSGTAVGASSPPAPPAPIDHHSALRSSGWPVRDQGQRGTCVAHAMAACKEALAVSAGAPSDQSEQFLFWGAKQLDPSAADGTLHGYALAALHSYGLCGESLWPYVSMPSPASVHQGPPPSPAIAAARSALHVGGGVTSPSNAQALYQALLRGPVAIGVPVFADPANPAKDNWNIGGMMEYGRIMEPPRRSVVVGGHAVCVLGFAPDAREPAGQGWFIIRNSWGTSSWGSWLPHGTYWGPEPGYGQISWSYVDSYLWELCWLY